MSTASNVDIDEEVAYGELVCDCVFGTGRMLIGIPSQKYTNHYENGTAWYDHHFVMGHSQLMFHVNHDDTRQLIHHLYNDVVVVMTKVSPLDKKREVVYSVLHGHDHFVVMELKLKTKTASI
jgi:hypothetical protein